MLHIKRVLNAKPKEHETVELAQIETRWAEHVDPAHVLEEHPMPQCARTHYHTLNGWWDCAFVECAQAAAFPLETVQGAVVPADNVFSQQILVPFSPEASLSSVGRTLEPGELLWYRHEIEAPQLQEGERCLLHFQAVDYACTCYVNNKQVGSHAGAYLPFTFDITDALEGERAQILLCVADPSEAGTQLRGKQRLDRGDIWYTAQSGIWQSVWLEVVPACFISELRVEADAATSTVTVGVRVGGCNEDAAAPQLKLEVFDGEELVGSASCAVSGETCALCALVPQPKLWSPDEPQLYTLRVQLGDDLVQSYCGFRTVELRRASDGHMRVHLNGVPLFMKGVLDQGYWPDGLMTAPSDEALTYDIEAMRACGFNMLRKHIKIEAARWYYHCDRLGMLVLQDMPFGGAGEMNSWHTSYKPTLFKASWTHYRDDTPGHQRALGSDDEAYQQEWTDTCAQLLRLHGGHPCIIGWTLFNEGWGQFDAQHACELVRALDPTRLIDATSGWYDQACGDFFSVHNYFRDMKVWKDRTPGRAFFLSEFGGLVFHIPEHSSLKKSYGYQTFETRADWQRELRKLLQETEAFERDGMAGYVYTQLSDIEEETNGILTYDRRVNKLMD